MSNQIDSSLVAPVSNRYFIHRKFFENYHQARLKENASNEQKSEEKLITFTNYNGPTISHHTSKKVLIPYLNQTNLDEKDHSTDTFSRNELAICFSGLLLQYLKNKLPNFISANGLLSKAEESFINTNEILLIGKLGIFYFSGRSFNWKANYSLSDLKNVLDGIQIDNVQKKASLQTSFNGNKGVIEKNNFEIYLHTNNFRFLNDETSYHLKFKSKASSGVISVQLDGNFRLIDLFIDNIQIFKIDFVRDKRRSYDKTSGSYLDIFDIRIGLSTLEISKKIY